MMEGIAAAAVAVILGLVGLVWGADRFVTGSAGAARNLGVSTLVIGLTIVSMGTSAPEIIVSINAALKEAGDIAVGNALGSNIANIGLVLGVTAMVAPLPAQRHLLVHEAPVLLVVTAWAGLVLYNSALGRGESLLMLLAVPTLLWITVRYKTRHPAPEEVVESQSIPRISTAAAVIWFLLGLGVMLLGAEVLVWGAKAIALQFGISQLVIGLTIVAIGTSLPELAASVMSALRGHHDIAIGNVIGSNLFNLLAVMPVAGVIHPLLLEPSVFYRDFMAMMLLTLVLVAAIVLGLRRSTTGVGRLGRSLGVFLLALYALYGAVLFLF